MCAPGNEILLREMLNDRGAEVLRLRKNLAEVREELDGMTQKLRRAEAQLELERLYRPIRKYDLA